MKSTSMIKMDRQRKIKMLTGAVAIKMAQQKGDPLYDKYQKYRQLYLETKQKIIEKYASKAKAVVRKSAASGQ